MDRDEAREVLSFLLSRPLIKNESGVVRRHWRQTKPRIPGFFELRDRRDRHATNR